MKKFLTNLSCFIGIPLQQTAELVSKSSFFSQKQTLKPENRYSAHHQESETTTNAEIVSENQIDVKKADAVKQEISEQLIKDNESKQGIAKSDAYSISDRVEKVPQHEEKPMNRIDEKGSESLSIAEGSEKKSNDEINTKSTEQSIEKLKNESKHVEKQQQEEKRDIKIEKKNIETLNQIEEQKAQNEESNKSIDLQKNKIEISEKLKQEGSLLEEKNSVSILHIDDAANMKNDEIKKSREPEKERIEELTIQSISSMKSALKEKMLSKKKENLAKESETIGKMKIENIEFAEKSEENSKMGQNELEGIKDQMANISKTIENIENQSANNIVRHIKNIVDNESNELQAKNKKENEAPQINASINEIHQLMKDQMVSDMQMVSNENGQNIEKEKTKKVEEKSNKEEGQEKKADLSKETESQSNAIDNSILTTQISESHPDRDEKAKLIQDQENNILKNARSIDKALEEQAFPSKKQDNSKEKQENITSSNTAMSLNQEIKQNESKTLNLEEQSAKQQTKKIRLRKKIKNPVDKETQTHISIFSESIDSIYSEQIKEENEAKDKSQQTSQNKDKTKENFSSKMIIYSNSVQLALRQVEDMKSQIKICESNNSNGEKNEKEFQFSRTESRYKGKKHYRFIKERK